MGKVRVRIKAPFGEIVIEGDDAQEILETLKTMTPEFMSDIGNLISAKLTPPIKTQLEGIVELTTEGPIITTREKLTHYEAIGLVLFASDKKSSTATNISRLLASSGIRSMVPARLNEMTKRGIVFKPDPARPEFKLTTQGERWIEEEVLVKLRGATG
jgi:predicted transcriptional regulator